MKLPEGLAAGSARFIYFIYALLNGITVYCFFTDFTMENYRFIAIGYLLAVVSAPIILYNLARYAEKMNPGFCFFVLLSLCFTIKLLWVLAFRIEPYADYKTFFVNAQSLAQNYIENKRYVALFPHIFGYSSFLSIFIRIFGADYMVAPIVNVFLSAISMALIYFICKKLGGFRAAVIGSLLWSLFPSQTIYNMLALSEPLYTTELLGIWALMVIAGEQYPQMKWLKLLGYSTALGLLLNLLNMSRPIAAVPFIAFSIWIFIIGRETGNGSGLLIRKAVLLLTTAVFYFIFNLLTGLCLTCYLGEEPSTTPGYSFYVGLNMEYDGRWNQEDSDLLLSYSNRIGWTAQDAQRQMLYHARSRLVSGGINFPELILNKYKVLTTDDSMAVLYTESALDHKMRYVIISNVFYHFVLSAAAFSAILLFKSKDKSPAIMLCLFFIGLVSAQMMVEVAKRYHYSLIPVAIILAALAFSKSGNKKQTTGKEPFSAFRS